MFRFNVNNHAKIDIEREEDPNDPVEIQLLSPMMTTDEPSNSPRNLGRSIDKLYKVPELLWQGNEVI